MGSIKHPKAYSILLVEDQPSNALVASTFLEMMGYAFDTAENGHDALRKFSEGNFSLILMDVQLPGIDGLETTRRIRRLEKERRMKPTPILAMTSNATVDDRTFCLRAGMDDYLSKPFRREELSSKISGFIAQTAKAANA